MVQNLLKPIDKIPTTSAKSEYKRAAYEHVPVIRQPLNKECDDLQQLRDLDAILPTDQVAWE